MKLKLGKGGFWILLRLVVAVALFPLMVVIVIGLELFHWSSYVLLALFFGVILLIAYELIDNLEVVQKEVADEK